MSQTKTGSLLESTVNQFSGFLLALITSFIVLPYYSTDQLNEVQVTLIYTIISFIRSYLWRRYFDQLSIFNKQEK